MLSEDIKVVDSIKEGRVSDSPVLAAWERIKTALAESQNTSTNSAMVPCPKPTCNVPAWLCADCRDQWIRSQLARHQ